EPPRRRRRRSRTELTIVVPPRDPVANLWSTIQPGDPVQPAPERIAAYAGMLARLMPQLVEAADELHRQAARGCLLVLVPVGAIDATGQTTGASPCCRPRGPTSWRRRTRRL